MEDIKKRIENPPLYKIGQCVFAEISTYNEIIKQKFSNKIEGFIFSIQASGTETKDTYLYGISLDLPRSYYYGEKPFMFILEDDINLSNK